MDEEETNTAGNLSHTLRQRKDRSHSIDRGFGRRENKEPKILDMASTETLQRYQDELAKVRKNEDKLQRSLEKQNEQIRYLTEECDRLDDLLDKYEKENLRLQAFEEQYNDDHFHMLTGSIKQIVLRFAVPAS